MIKVDVSVIIPTYNRLWSLPRAVESCFDPALNIEVIVVDDGSTDGTWEWLAQQKNILAVRQDNCGKDWAVNRGFATASGKYIRFLDSDDWIVNGSSAELLAEAEEKKLDVTCAGYLFVDENEKLINEIKWTDCDDFLAQQLGECDSSHYSAYLFRRDFIIDVPHRQEFGALDDRQFMVEVAMKHPTTGFINSPSFVHRKHTKERLQIASGLAQNANNLARLTIYKKCIQNLKERGQLTERYKKVAASNLWPLAHWIAIDHPGEAAAVVDWIYQLNPDFQAPEKGVLGSLYKKIGFKNTERLLSLRRKLLFR